ncbi:MAG: alpha/beta fold hydrolase [Planctomycetota bacterium]
MNVRRIDFRSHPLLPGGNLQTLAGLFLPRKYEDYRATRRWVTLADGDRIVLHDDTPGGWRHGDPTAVLLHGLGGCHASPYVRRMAEKLNARGVRTFRLDLRGCGAGEQAARGGTHCCSWEDVGEALEAVARWCPDSETLLVGYSLGGALALNLAGTMGGRPRGNLTAVCAVCPPMDLHAIDEAFNHGAGRLYSRHFARMMHRTIVRRLANMDDPPEVDVSRKPRSIRELDERITAPHAGYADADAYYADASPAPRLDAIRTPTLIIAADDDPVIPIEPLESAQRSPWVEAWITRGGGHLGFLSPRGDDPDCRWVDWRIVEWAMRHVRFVSTASAEGISDDSHVSSGAAMC